MMWNQRWNLYNAPSNHKPLSKFNMAATDATIIFQAHSVTLKYDLMFYLTQNWFLCMYSGILCHIKIWLYCTIPYSENLGMNNMLLLKSYQRFTADSPRWQPWWWRHLPMSDIMWSSRGKNCRMTFSDGKYFPLYLLSRACSWMTTEMVEVSNRVNFGSKPGRLTCPEKSRKHADPMIARPKGVRTPAGRAVSVTRELDLSLLCRIWLFGRHLVSLAKIAEVWPPFF